MFASMEEIVPHTHRELSVTAPEHSHGEYPWSMETACIVKTRVEPVGVQTIVERTFAGQAILFPENFPHLFDEDQGQDRF